MTTVLHAVGYGDSITQGPSSVTVEGGAPGNWFEQWSNRLADMTGGIQPIISPGFRGLWRSLALAFASDAFGSVNDEWQVDAVAHWSPTSQGSAWNKAPHGQMWDGANGSGSTATWTKQPGMAPIVGFDLLYVDGPSSGNWQYQIDGGTWTAMGQSNVQDNQLKKFYVASSASSTVGVRQFDGTGAAHLYMVGIIPYYNDPRSTNGMVFHDLGRFGFPLRTTAGMCASNPTGSSGAADPLAFFDSCVLGTNAAAHTPRFSTLEFGANDIALSVSASQNATDLASYATRYRAKIQIPLISWKMYEGNGDATQQSLYRTNQDTFQSNNSSWVTQIDLFTAYQNLGFGGTGTQNANITGVLLNSDATHPNSVGSYDIGQRFFDLTRTTLYPTSYPFSWSYASPFTVGSSQVGTTDELAGAPDFLFSDTDTGTGTDAGESIAIAISDTDAGTGTDAGESIADFDTITDTDPATGTDDGSLTNSQTDAETAAATDAGEQITQISIGAPSGLAGLTSPSEEIATLALV